MPNTTKQTVAECADTICELYRTSFSVSDVLRELQLTPGCRRHVEALLKDRGLYQGIGGLNATSRAAKTRSTMRRRYGVINAGQMPNGGYSAQNKRPIQTYAFQKHLSEYRRRVDEITSINKKKLIPRDFCYYTGVRFVDADTDSPNPNDPRKRCVDHKLSVWAAFVTGVPPEIVACTSNLVFCLRYANGIKANMSADEFVPHALLIREMFKHEGIECNPD